jgi:hypothetical protein
MLPFQGVLFSTHARLQFGGAGVKRRTFIDKALNLKLLVDAEELQYRTSWFGSRPRGALAEFEHLLAV